MDLRSDEFEVRFEVVAGDWHHVAAFQVDNSVALEQSWQASGL